MHLNRFPNDVCLRAVGGTLNENHALAQFVVRCEASLCFLRNINTQPLLSEVEILVLQ